jgi:hypothetical protein
MKKIAAVAAMLAAGVPLFAADPRLAAMEGPGRRTPGVPSFEMDRNNDGKTDCRFFIDSKGRKTYEEYDFNYDGLMDDFYYYAEGTLDREEIDSDFNGKIDIWITLYQGKYIRRIEQDRNGDGKPDAVTDYDRKK